MDIYKKNIVGGISPLSIVAATFLVNFRHFVMSASLGSRLDKPKKWQIPLIGFGVTDETFSVIMTKKGNIPALYV